MKMNSGPILTTLLAIGLLSGNAFSQTEIKPTTESKPAAPKKKAPAPKSKSKAKSDGAVKSTAKPAATASALSEPITATVMRDRVNVRGQASINGEVITQLKKGEIVLIVEEISAGKPVSGQPTGWAKIQMPANTPVWVNASFVDSASKTVKSAKLNVRAGPGENFSVIGVLPKDSVVKEIRSVDTWMEIETPPGTYGFVAAEYLKKGEIVAIAKAPEPTPTPEPVPAPIPTTVTDAPKPVAATEAPKPAVTPESAPTAVVPVPSPAPVAAPAPTEEEPLLKRTVTRQGIVARTLSIQAPTAYGLANSDNGAIMNYLMPADADTNIRAMRGQHVIVTGEEYVDPRWPKLPILKVEQIIPAE